MDGEEQAGEEDSDEELDAEVDELRSALAAQNRERAVRLARVSRLVFGLGVVLLVVLVLVWILGALATSDAGFRVLALAVVVLLGLGFLTGALSTASHSERRSALPPTDDVNHDP